MAPVKLILTELILIVSFLGIQALPSDRITPLDLHSKKTVSEGSVPEKKVEDQIPEQKVEDEILDQQTENFISGQQIKDHIPEQAVENQIREQQVANQNITAVQTRRKPKILLFVFDYLRRIRSEKGDRWLYCIVYYLGCYQIYPPPAKVTLG
ncbi:uncharacterized protein LOC136030132 [Artemia franciscana]|uniref:uncharacterized protein LOC136030132 n=1 Tax=Artemia franciscana TaxID=6661 RepID=UPI0032DB1EEF